jgi:hypothetical protein
LRATGSFYVPVQFASDNLAWDIVKPGPLAQRLVQGPDFALVEIREA